MNILDYLDWRGDLSFAASKPNEVDALIFAWLVYYHFEDLEEGSFEGITLSELASLHEKTRGSFQKIRPETTIDPVMTATWLLYCASRTERFASVKICDFLRKQSGELPADAGWENQNRGIPKDMVQENQLAGFDAFRAEIQDIQFAAVSFILEDGEGELRVIAYRGTDDSITGWKEDCYLAISDTVPAQKTGLQYLEDTADGRRALICGHSKGGNLAVYAALFASDNRRTEICSVYNFDGPGFCFDMRKLESYNLLKDRIVTIVPESSVVGMLLEHEDDYRIVESRSMGLLQHDALFWQVLGNRFVYADKRNESSLIADQAIKEWIAGMSLEERREFVDALFGILEGTGAVRTTELPEKLVQNGFRNLIHSPEDRGRKKIVLHVLLKLIKAGNSNLYESVRHSETVKEIMGHSEKQRRLS